MHLDDRDRDYVKRSTRILISRERDRADLKTLIVADPQRGDNREHAMRYSARADSTARKRRAESDHANENSPYEFRLREISIFPAAEKNRTVNRKFRSSQNRRAIAGSRSQIVKTLSHFPWSLSWLRRSQHLVHLSKEALRRYRHYVFVSLDQSLSYRAYR